MKSIHLKDTSLPVMYKYLDRVWWKINSSHFPVIFQSSCSEWNVSDLVLPEAAELEVVPAEDGEEPGGGGEPRQPDHHQRALLRPAPQVAQRRGDGPVPGIALVTSS